jgi:hypothetical protein
VTAIYRFLPLAAPGFALGTSIAAAQTNNRDNSAGTPRSRVAMPTYPSGQSNPALSPGRLPQGETGVQAEKSPNVPGATGTTVVPGNRSTIGTDRRATNQQKTGQTSSSDAN